MWPHCGRRLLVVSSVGLLFAATAKGAPAEASKLGGPEASAVLSPLSAVELHSRAQDDVFDDPLDEEELREEEACGGQEAMSNVMTSELEKLRDPTSPWAKFLSKLTAIKDAKQVCTQSQTSEGLCSLPEAPEGGSSTALQLPCGGDDYMKLISNYVRTKNCILSLAVTQTLTQNWLGHAGSDGIFPQLIAKYEKALEYASLDSELYSLYQDSAQLLREVIQSAKDGIAAFHSPELKAVFLKRRKELTALLCALGRGAEADTGANVVVSDHMVVIRGNFEESEEEALTAFQSAVDTFGLYVQALLEDGGFLQRATDIHVTLHKFRLSKLSAMLTDIEPSTNEGDDALSLMRIIPGKHNKQSKHKTKEVSNKTQDAAAPAFLESAAQQGAVAAAAAVAAANLATPATAPQQQQALVGGTATTVPAAAPDTMSLLGPSSPAAQTFLAGEQQAPAQGGAQTWAPAPLPAAPSAALEAAPAPTSPSGNPPPHAEKGDHAGHPPAHGIVDGEHKGVPIRQKTITMAAHLRMFEMHGEELGYTADVSALSKTIKAGYTDITDKIFVVWAQFLPQAFVSTTFKFLSLLLPNPVVDIAEFYNSTMAEDGSVTEGFTGDLPVNHKLLAERFSVAVDEAYKDSWRRFFEVADDLGVDNDQSGSVAQQAPPVSALQEVGAVKPHSFVSTEENDDFSVAIVSSSDGITPTDLDKYIDSEAIDKASVEALVRAMGTFGVLGWSLGSCVRLPECLGAGIFVVDRLVL
ncbi:uncharacterized protein LOC34617317 [Cyclospora cayetanensis]|uniref:Uncharacterized protein LOC34617317 n=1 Tax=Cyclospora cayetanensis TaxID=88456 RepID=A0A6P6RZG7_9EIME|nr:uncharacterized protein LOC34617317 [Cyclospora cayetanensis]